MVKERVPDESGRNRWGHSGHMNRTSSLPGSIARGSRITAVSKQMSATAVFGEMV